MTQLIESKLPEIETSVIPSPLHGNEPPQSDWSNAGHFATVVSAIAALIGTAIAIAAFAYQMSQQRADVAAAAVREWQQVVVFGIIDEANMKGVSFPDIRQRYLEKVSQSDDIPIPKTELSDAALNRELLQLITFGAAYRGHDGRYYPNTVVMDPRFGRDIAEEGARYKLLNFLATDSGKYSPSDLEAKVGAGLTREEFETILSRLGASGEIFILDGKVWSRIPYLLKFAKQPEKGSEATSEAPKD